MVSITLPSLSERGRDLDLLIDHFVAIHGKKYRKESLSIPDEVRTELRQYGWPGNVRELAHTVERMVLISNQETLASPSLDLQDAAGGSAAPPPMTPDRISFDFENGSCTLAEVETRLLEQALDFTGGNVSEVARLLGLTRGALRHRLDKRGL